MKPTRVHVRVLRSLLLNGEHVAAGRQIECTAPEAALLIESTRAALVDPADLALIRDAVNSANAECVRRERKAGQFRANQ